LPGVLVGRESRLARLIAACSPLAPLRTAIVAPDEIKALAGALLARDHGLIAPLLIGDPAAIKATADKAGLTLGDAEIIAAADYDAAAAAAIALVTSGNAAAVMKGNLHTDTLLRHVVKSDGGLRTARRISHCFVMDAPALEQLLVISDAAIAIAPTLEEKVDITQNAIDLACALGIATPRVGVLSAVETVNPKIPSTLDAAALSKMAERGQIRGGLVDGPLAMDNALSISAAKTKGIAGLVAGRADVLIAPNLEAGNILVKGLTYAASAEGGGLIVGAKAPVMLTSRADDAQDRLASCALAILYAHWRRTGESAVG
jgi:phosphate butyryltransferase